MVENIIKNQETNETLSEDKELGINEKNETSKEITVEEKLKETEDKLLRSLAEIENQRLYLSKYSKAPLDRASQHRAYHHSQNTPGQKASLDRAGQH